MKLSTQPVAPLQVPSHHRRLTHIRELDGIRGIAAIMVFFIMFALPPSSPQGWDAPVRFLHNISKIGNSGVDLFFVLSGFLITSLLIEDHNRSSYFHDFYWKRVLRILPLYLVCLLGVLLFIPGSCGYVLLSALFVSNFAWIFHIPSTGPFWTLAIEEQFYILWPTGVRRRSVPQLRHWAISIGMGAVLLRFIAAAFGHHNYYFTFFRCDGLAFGAFLACWYSQRGGTVSTSARENRAIFFGFALGMVLIALSAFNGTSLQAEAFLAAFQQTGVTLLCGSIIAFLIGHTGQRALFFLRSRTLTFFGLISYAMYMTHLYVLMAYDHLQGPLTTGDDAMYAPFFRCSEHHNYSLSSYSLPH